MKNEKEMSDNAGAALPKPSGQRRKSVLLWAAVFLLGALAGGAVTVLVGIKVVQRAVKYPEQVPDRIAQRLKWKLELSDAQAQQVREILMGGQKELMAIRAEVQPRVHAEFDQVSDEISAILTDAQREEWKVLFGQMRDKWAPPLPGEEK